MKRLHIILLTVFILALAWSAYQPKDYFTWFLEVLPVLIGVTILAATYRRFRLTELAYVLILVHCCILFVGGHYTYAEVPLFDWIRDFFHQTRNNYDKVGHFAQGFIPAIITREVLVRLNVVNSARWRNVIVVSMSLSYSAMYEFFEWFVAVASGESADAFLGTQGYVWDTQSDMLYATIGAIAALVLLSRIHDAQMQKIPAKNVRE